MRVWRLSMLRTNIRFTGTHGKTKTRVLQHYTVYQISYSLFVSLGEAVVVNAESCQLTLGSLWRMSNKQDGYAISSLYFLLLALLCSGGVLEWHDDLILESTSSMWNSRETATACIATNTRAGVTHVCMFSSFLQTTQQGGPPNSIICGRFFGPFKLRKSLRSPHASTKVLQHNLCRDLFPIMAHTRWLDWHTTMGASSASKVLHRLVGLSLDHVVNAAKQLTEKNGQKDTASETSCWDRRASSGIYESRWLFEESRIYNVCVVFYPSYRHQSNCASMQRCGAREAASITAYETKVETMMVSQSIRCKKERKITMRETRLVHNL